MPFPYRRLALLLLLPLVFLGCDTAETMFEDDTVFVNEDLEVLFSFDADSFDASGVATATGDRSFLIDGLLQGSGFSRADIVSISAVQQGAELLIEFPIDADIDEISQAELRLGNLLAATAQVTMTDDDEVLTITGTDLTPLSNAAGFDTSLRVVLADPSAPRDYTLEARITLRFEVQP